jgi:hypothetical protein
MHNHNNTNTFKFHGLSQVPMNNLLINEANPESNESVVSQHSGISNSKRVYWEQAKKKFHGNIEISHVKLQIKDEISRSN